MKYKVKVAEKLVSIHEIEIECDYLGDTVDDVLTEIEKKVNEMCLDELIWEDEMEMRGLNIIKRNYEVEDDFNEIELLDLEEIDE